MKTKIFALPLALWFALAALFCVYAVPDDAVTGETWDTYADEFGDPILFGAAGDDLFAETDAPSQRLLPRFVDHAGLLTVQQGAQLEAVLDDCSTACGCEIVILTEQSTGTRSVQAYADDFYDENLYGFGEERDGLLLLLRMEDRAWAVSTCGAAHARLTVHDIDALIDAVAGDLRVDDFDAAFTAFAYATLDQLLSETADRNAATFDGTASSIKTLWNPQRALLAVGIAFALSFIVLRLVAGKLKTVAFNRNADSYIRPGSFALTQSHEHFLYSNVHRTPRPQNTDSGSASHGTHVSSSGHSHGGSSGHF